MYVLDNAPCKTKNIPIIVKIPSAPEGDPKLTEGEASLPVNYKKVRANKCKINMQTV